MKKNLLILLGITAWAFTALIAFYKVLSGNIPFWYDPARDMLLAWDNLSKLTLIGPTSGIPGIFYGPYWIWWLSIGELLSKDPRIVILFTTTLPYFFVFGFLMYLYRKLLDPLTILLLWLLFFYSIQGLSLATTIWNPNLVIILYAAVLYLLVTKNYEAQSRFFERTFFAGALSALALNIQISFSSGFVVGCLVFLIGQGIVRRNSLKNRILTLSKYITGFSIVYIPFFLFELRHGFSQTKVLLNTLAHQGGVISLHGLTRSEILFNYFMKFSQLLQISYTMSIALVVFGVLCLGFLVFLKKISLSGEQKKLLALLSIISASVLGIYLAAKNPIWEYHFIGVEIITLLFMGVLISKIPFVKYFLLIWVIYLSIGQFTGFIASTKINLLATGSLVTKEYIVSLIQKDGGSKDYTVYSYSPSIYTYEYEYLFRWMTGREFSYDPGQIIKKGTIYLILPPGKAALLEDFIHYRAPDAGYRTTKQWQIPDGTIVLRKTPKQ